MCGMRQSVRLRSAICQTRSNTRNVANIFDGGGVGSVNVWEVPGYRTEMTPFGGIKQSGLGYKEDVLEAMRGFIQLKTYSLPWPV